MYKSVIKCTDDLIDKVTDVGDDDTICDGGSGGRRFRDAAVDVACGSLGFPGDINVAWFGCVLADRCICGW